MNYAKKVRKPNTIMKYAIAACMSVVVCLAIILPIVLKPRPGNMPDSYVRTEYSSMQDYSISNDITVKSFGQIVSGASITETQDYQIKQSECNVISDNEMKDVCIEEKYTLINDDSITVSMLLASDEGVMNEFFADYTDLDKSINISNTTIAYSYDQSSYRGMASFDYNGYRFYVLFNVQLEEQILNFLQIFIMLQ